MSYTKLQSDIPGQLRVQLDTGARVEVSYTIERDAITNGACIRAYAVQVDPEHGTVELDATGQPVHAVLPYAASAELVAALGLDRIVRALLLAVLGEPLEINPAVNAPWVPLSAELLASVSIRTAIISAAHGAAEINPEGLL